MTPEKNNDSDLLEICETFLNGNLTDARVRMANGGYSILDTASVFMDHFGTSEVKALRAAIYIKEKEGFQDYCDAK